VVEKRAIVQKQWITTALQDCMTMDVVLFNLGTFIVVLVMVCQHHF